MIYAIFMSASFTTTTIIINSKILLLLLLYCYYDCQADIVFMLSCWFIHSSVIKISEKYKS